MALPHLPTLEKREKNPLQKSISKVISSAIRFSSKVPLQIKRLALSSIINDLEVSLSGTWACTTKNMVKVEFRVIIPVIPLFDRNQHQLPPKKNNKHFWKQNPGVAQSILPLPPFFPYPPAICTALQTTQLIHVELTICTLFDGSNWVQQGW